MKAGLYARVSLDRQRENYSIPTQLEAMRDYCAKSGLEVVREYIEDESGARLNRPALDKVREDAAQGLFDVLVCHDVDRFGRNLGHQILLEEEFAKHGVQVRYVLGDYKDNPEGRLTKHIKGVIAEYEREKITERTFRGRLGRGKSGQVSVSNHHPYGYVYKSEGRRGWLEIVPYEAEVVKQMYRLYVEERLSIQGIAAKLTQAHIPTRTKADQWSPTSVTQILSSETYAGVWHDNKRKHGKGVNDRHDWIPVQVPAIISRDLWEAAQETRANNRERLRKHAKYPYLLAGILRCGACGRAIIGITSVPGPGRRPRAYHYYRCSDSTKRWKHQRCLGPKLYAEEADALVWGRIAEALRNPQLLTEEYARLRGEGLNARDGDRLNELDARIGNLKRQQDRNLDLYVEGVIDMAALKERQEKLRGQRASLEREREAMQKMLSYAKTEIESLAQFCQSISQRLDDVSLEEKRQILYLLNIEGRVKDGIITLTGCIPKAEAMAGCCGYSSTQQSQEGSRLS